jgi:hypothetical protein
MAFLQWATNHFTNLGILLFVASVLGWIPSIIYSAKSTFSVLRWERSPVAPPFTAPIMTPLMNMLLAVIILVVSFGLLIFISFPAVVIIALINFLNLGIFVASSQNLFNYNPTNRLSSVPAANSELNDVAKDILYKHFTKKPDSP